MGEKASMRIIDGKEGHSNRKGVKLTGAIGTATEGTGTEELEIEFVFFNRGILETSFVGSGFSGMPAQ